VRPHLRRVEGQNRDAHEVNLLISFPPEHAVLPAAVWQTLQNLLPHARLRWLEADAVPHAAAEPEPASGGYGLSEREQHILSLLASNRPVKEIASALHLSRHTVNNHTRNIYRKLGVGSRAGAIALLLRGEGRAAASR
jgi:DNA-binding CsgD family transcriptional regulator